LDSFDENIIAELRINARISVSSLATKINLSRTAVTGRIKKLEKSGVIRGYQVLLSESQNEGVSVYIEVQHMVGCCGDIIKTFQKIPEVMTCRSITGDTDLIVFIQAGSMQRIHEIRELLDKHVGIIKIRTHVVLSEWKDSFKQLK